VFFNLDDLGEKTLNKIAEIALARQFERVEKLSVGVKTDPNRLAKGALESLVIHGTGLVTSDRLQIQELKMTFSEIAVSPIKALMGNIELTHPSQGSADVVLSQTDLEKAFDLKALGQQLQNTQISWEGAMVTLSLDRVACRIFANSKVAIYAEVSLRPLEVQKEICLSFKPAIASTGTGIVLENIQGLEDSKLSAAIGPMLLAEAEKILNLSKFQLEGISLQNQQLEIQEKQIILQAAAEIFRFPSS
jgi:hypothetical protein